MKIEEAIIAKAFFEDFGARRVFSAEFKFGSAHQNYPYFAFPKENESYVSQQLCDFFNINNIKKIVDIPCYVISENSQIWGMMNQEGFLFSMLCFYPEAGKNSVMQECLLKFAQEYPQCPIDEVTKIKSAVSLFGLDEKNSQALKSKRLYQNIVLNFNLQHELIRHTQASKKIKV